MARIEESPGAKKPNESQKRAEMLKTRAVLVL